MNVEATANQALENLMKMTECLEQSQKVLADHQQSLADLSTIVKFQQERIDQQANALRALQAMCRTLDGRLKAQEGFAA